MRASVQAFEQYGVHFTAQPLDAVVNPDPVLLPQCFGVSFDSRPTRRDVLAAAGECGDDFRTRHVALRLRIIQYLRELRNMRSVTANDADTQLRAGRCHAKKQGAEDESR